MLFCCDPGRESIKTGGASLNFAEATTMIYDDFMSVKTKRCLPYFQKLLLVFGRKLQQCPIQGSHANAAFPCQSTAEFSVFQPETECVVGWLLVESETSYRLEIEYRTRVAMSLSNSLRSLRFFSVNL